jgi:cyanophycin synthetase
VGDRAVQEIEYVLAAVGAAWALGIPLDLIRMAVETFEFGQESNSFKYLRISEKQKI